MPWRCLHCKDIVQEGPSLCGACWSKLEHLHAPGCRVCGRNHIHGLTDADTCVSCLYMEPLYNHARGLYKFNGVSKKLVHLLKYYDNTVLAEFFAKQLHGRYHDMISCADAITYVPMHWAKRLMRWYNPAQLIAKELARFSRKPLLDALTKAKWTKSQSSLGKHERKTNLSGSIVAKDGLKVKSIILVDDVITTGATLNACAKALKMANVEKICALAVLIR